MLYLPHKNKEKMKKTALALLCSASMCVHSQTYTGNSFTGESDSSVRALIETGSQLELPAQYADSTPQTVITTIGHSNGDFFFLHDHSVNSFNGPELGFNINTTQFTRDAEYFLPETKGYTAVGFFLQPTLKYRIRLWEPFNIEAGAQILGIAGDDSRLHLKPVFRIEYQPLSWLRIIGGTIYGNLNHALYEPMYDFDRYFYNNQENGLQLLLDKEWTHMRIKSDTWLNWENFLEPGEAEQERFTVGSSNRIKFGSESKKTFQIPIDIIATPRGGQFTALKDTALETLFNVATGADWVISNHWRITALAFGYKNNSGTIYTPFKQGYGLYPILTFYNKNLALSGGYWYGNKYIGARGSHLFMSVSKYDPDFTQKDRNMLTGKCFYQHGILGLEAQAYHDLKENKTDFSFGIYLKFNREFSILEEKSSDW